VKNDSSLSKPPTRRRRPTTPHVLGQATDVSVRRADFQSPLADRLILALNQELDDRYPEEGANHFDLAAEEVSEGHGAFLIAFVADEPVGCGAVRRISPTVCEIKRMYVAPSARSRGVGRRILDELETIAHQLGASRLVLETGVRQPEALALYTHAGFTTIPLFGNYALAPHPELSVCMAKDL
jgi:GNAT superfamily N-acetyltransferase